MTKTRFSRTLLSVALAVSLLAPAVANADIYMHGPRGSNNSTNSSQSVVDAVLSWLGSLFE